jgi:hypothetical protein
MHESSSEVIEGRSDSLHGVQPYDVLRALHFRVNAPNLMPLARANVGARQQHHH